MDVRRVPQAEGLRRMDEIVFGGETSMPACWDCGHPARAHERLHGGCLVSIEAGLCPCEQYRSAPRPAA